eukprot:889222-Lingulodinium_polyedra.AAC.1
MASAASCAARLGPRALRARRALRHTFSNKRTSRSSWPVAMILPLATLITGGPNRPTMLQLVCAGPQTATG